MIEQPSLIDLPTIPDEPKEPARKSNPMLRVYGAGPDGVICRNCAHLRVKHWSGTYYKCMLRGNTNGPGTDHRLRWPACGKFEDRE